MKINIALYECTENGITITVVLKASPFNGSNCIRISEIVEVDFPLIEKDKTVQS